MSYELRPVTTAQDRAAMHAIRRATLFTPDRPGGIVVYDENHPHDLDPAKIDPASVSVHSTRLSESIATRSPGPAPIACSPAAIDFARCSI